MRRLMKNITDSLADAAFLELGVDVNRTPEHVSGTAHEPLIAAVKRFFRNFSITMADAALLEVGVGPEKTVRKSKSTGESIEENLVEVAFAEAADYDDIHTAIRREHRSEQDTVRPDECQYGDNDVCFA